MAKTPPAPAAEEEPTLLAPLEEEAAGGLRCPECGDAFPTPMRLGYHRRVAHGVQGKGGHKRRPGRSGGAESRSVVVDTIRDMASDAGAGKSGTAAPNASELTRAFGRGIGMGTLAAATYAVESDRRLTTDALKEQTIDYLALSPGAAVEVAAPIARAFQSTGLNKRYGRTIVNNVDVVGSLAELSMLFMHWRRYFRERAEWERSGGMPSPAFTAVPAAPLQPNGQGAQAAPPLSSAPAPAEQPAAPLTPPNGGVPATQGGGHVWTPADVDRMRGGGRG